MKKILDIARDYWKSLSLFIAIDLEIFDYINSYFSHNFERDLNGLIEKISEDKDIDPERIKELLLILEKLELVSIIDDQIYLENESELLVKDEPCNILSMIEHYKYLYKQKFSFKNKKLIKPNYINLAKGIESVNNRVSVPNKVLSKIKKKNVLLDVGCGSGWLGRIIEKETKCYMYYLDKRKENINSKIDDKEIFIEEFVNFQPIKDINDSKMLFDGLILSEYLHCKSYEENLLVIKKCYEILKPNGYLIIREQISDFDIYNKLFSINMMMTTEHGRSYSINDIFSLIKNYFQPFLIERDEIGMSWIILDRRR